MLGFFITSQNVVTKNNSFEPAKQIVKVPNTISLILRPFQNNQTVRPCLLHK